MSHKQQSLFDRPIDPTPAYKLARRHDPYTSHEAAETVDTTKMEGLVLDVIRDYGAHGCISDQVRDALPGYAYSSVTARFKALEEKGFIFYAGDKLKGRSGRQQRIIRATPE